MKASNSYNEVYTPKKLEGLILLPLLALNDDGAPFYNKKLAQVFANMDIPTFACTPDQFPELMASSINGDDILSWAADQDIVVAK